LIVGFLGGTPFITSRAYVYTFDDYTRSSSGRWAKHDVIGQKPLLEFLGSDIEEIGFKMKLRSDQGISPRVELEKLRRYRDEGRIMSLVLGGRVVGKTKWIIESISEAVNYWSRSGQIFSVDIDIKLKEYRT